MKIIVYIIFILIILFIIVELSIINFKQTFLPNVPYRISNNCFIHKYHKCSKSNSLNDIACINKSNKECIVPITISSNYCI